MDACLKRLRVQNKIGVNTAKFHVNVCGSMEYD